MNEKKLKEILVHPGYISEEDFNRAKSKIGNNYKAVCSYLIDHDLIKDEELGLLMAQFLGYPFVNLRKEKIDQKTLQLIDLEYAKKIGVIVFSQNNKEARAGFLDPSDKEKIHILEKIVNKKVAPYYITENDFKETLLLYKKDINIEFEEIFFNLEKEKKEGTISNFNNKLVDTILEYAYFSKASDLHLEPFKDRVLIRFRIDGVMHEITEFPKKFFESILSRIKILAKLRTDDHFSAQDGSFQHKIERETVDLRVSIIPITSGEKVVMRLLASGNRQKKLSSLGFSQKDLLTLNKYMESPHGMILVTGPTGSGKTTTIYELLKVLNKEEVNISTIEDPVEYDIERVNQIQVNKKTNLTFASGLRAIVRQDPDIIMVGEIRDSETAEIAVNSAMTGHLVLSTMHANDASTTLPRLGDMKIENFLISSTVNIIIGQRLVRKICEKCRVSYSLSKEEESLIKTDKTLLKEIEQKGKKISSLVFYKGAGCKICTNTGYKGRIGIFEILEISDEIRKLINKKASSDEIKKTARGEGMKTMMEDGIEKALKGETSLSEVLKVSRD